MIRLAILTSSFPRYIGDHAGIFVYELAKHLVDDNMAVHVLAPHDDNYPQREIWNGVTVHRFRYVPPGIRPTLCYGSGIVDNLKGHPLTWLQIPLYVFSMMSALKKLIYQENITIINSHWLLVQGLGAAMSKKKREMLHISTIHSSELTMLTRIPFGGSLARFVLKQADQTICVSERSKQRLEKAAGIPVQAHIMPMGIDVTKFLPKTPSCVLQNSTSNLDSYKILFVGRLIEVKGLIYLLQALPAVKDQIGNIELCIVGIGKLAEELKNQVERLGLHEQVKFAGYVPNEDLPSYYHSADVVVVPSMITDAGYEEGMPVVLLEALAAGCRVVVTRTGGAPELIQDGKNGFLAEPADPTSLAQAICRALTTTEISQVEYAARETVKRFDWPIIASAYRNIIQEIVRSQE
ncbi:MAG TPA: glycosyltransferase family 4 protein [Chloroflexi bacterium]|nr:glycosyltransferase family 4 protein [Chloroflexota bacterium]